MIKELKIIVRAHYGVSQGLCPLCAQSSQGARTGLYDNGAHLGDLCRQCLQGGRRGASARTRLHSAELRRLAERVQGGPLPGVENNMGRCWPGEGETHSALDC